MLVRKRDALRWTLIAVLALAVPGCGAGLVGGPELAAPAGGAAGTSVSSAGASGGRDSGAGGTAAGGTGGAGAGGAGAGAGGAAAPMCPPAGCACAPSGGGPYWVEEGATVTAPIKCMTGSAPPMAGFTLANLPPGAVYDAATATLRWTTGLDAAGVYLVTVSVPALGESSELKIGVADKFDDLANLPIKNPAAYTEEFGLPVFHFAPSPTLDTTSLAETLALHAGVVDNGCQQRCSGIEVYVPITITYRGVVYKAEVKYRGASSLDYPKRSYTLRFNQGIEFTEPSLAAGRIRKRKKLTLTTTFDDNSYVRWRLAFETWNRTDAMTIQIPHYSAVVYVNNKYQGLFTVSDKIDGDLLKAAGLHPDANVFMAIGHAANFYDTQYVRATATKPAGPQPKICFFEGFTRKQGTPAMCEGTTFNSKTAFNDLMPLLDFVMKSPDQTFRTDLPKWIEVRDYVNWFIHVTAITAGDTYGKNALHVHDPATSAPWRVVLWDFNDSFGQDYSTLRIGPMEDPRALAVVTPMTYYENNNLWRRMWLDSTYGPQIRARYADMLKKELKLETVQGLFEGLVKETDASARRDERRWGAAYKMYYRPKRTDLIPYAGEVAYMRAWLVKRWAYLNSVFP